MILTIFFNLFIMFSIRKLFPHASTVPSFSIGVYVFFVVNAVIDDFCALMPLLLLMMFVGDAIYY